MIEPAAAAATSTEAVVPQPVGIGEAIVAGSGARLVAFGLGSCVGLTAWDPVTRVGGLAHFMLASGSREGAVAKYIDTGLPWFLNALSKAGASSRRLQFKAAGGAAMFLGVSGSLEVGRRNVDALDRALASAGLKLISQDLRGTIGRSIELDVRTGQLTVRTIRGTSIL
jgi:chemotaxis protein CheD